MELPAEIRNTIYEYALFDPSGMNFIGIYKHSRRDVDRVSAQCLAAMTQAGWSDSIHINDGVRKNHEKPVALVPSLLGVNKQIHKEGVDILYGKNEFVFQDSFALHNFLINLGPSGAKHLKTIRVLGWLHGRCRKEYNHSCFALLASATNITALHLISQIGGYSPSKYGAGQLYCSAFPWMEAVGMAKGKVDAVIDIIKFDKGRCHSGFDPVPNTCLVDKDKHSEEEYAEFKATLRKLLVAQQQRVMAPPAPTRSKAAKKEAADEE
jgi:hypothetical protein